MKMNSLLVRKNVHIQTCIAVIMTNLYMLHTGGKESHAMPSSGEEEEMEEGKQTESEQQPPVEDAKNDQVGRSLCICTYVSH